MKTLIRYTAVLLAALALTSCADPYLNGPYDYPYPDERPRHERPRHDRPRHERPRHDHRPLDEGMNRSQRDRTVF